MLSRLISSTQGIPERNEGPKHVAIVMDGNGRWARKRLLPRVAGHKRGLDTVRNLVKLCVEREVSHLTLFAFSSENWRRPADEVSFLMQLFMQALRQEVAKLHKNNIRLRVVGDLSRFDPELVQTIREAEAKTADNTALMLSIAANYGGRWDMLNAINQMTVANPGRQGHFSEADLAPYLCLADAPEPDLFIRTGGEQRVSNFLLWQLAYTELYFTDCLWPDFDAAAFDKALAFYSTRERRFGRTSEQLDHNGTQEKQD
jgi:undecaprenyl diphosphate synthase